MIRAQSTFELHSFFTDAEQASSGEAPRHDRQLTLDEFLSRENAPTRRAVLVLDQSSQIAAEIAAGTQRGADDGEPSRQQLESEQHGKQGRRGQRQRGQGQREQGQWGPQFVGIDPELGHPVQVADRPHAVAGMWTIDRRIGKALVMIPYRDGILVDGLPAPPLSTLASRSSIVLTPGVHTYLTERIRPHVGKPTDDMIGMRCAFCKIPIARDDDVVSHRCGVVYHHATDPPDRELDADARQIKSCFDQVALCLSCSRRMTLHDELVWDPDELLTR